MFKKFLVSLLAFSLVFTGISVENKIYAAEKQELNIGVITTDNDNDLYKTLVDNYDGIYLYDTIAKALENDKLNGLMVLADNYPNNTTLISEEDATAIKEAGIRLYVEYPSNNDTLGISGYSGSVLMNGFENGNKYYNRGIITNASTMNMTKHSLLYVLGARLAKKQLTPTSIDSDTYWMVASRVAGYDVAEFGISEATYSLIEVKDNIMVASTKFSQFISGRYAPYERYQKFWMSILSWVSGISVNSIEWKPLMTTSYGPTDTVDTDDYLKAVEMNTDWYIDSGMVLSSTDHDVYVNNKNSVIEYDETGEMNLTNNGTGIYGILEAFSSGWGFNEDGSQKVRFVRRADCNGESAGNIALAGVVLNNKEYTDIAYNVVNWLLTESIMSQGPRADVNSPEYGLLSWDDRSQTTIDAYYGDDNAKAILGLISAVSALRKTGDYNSDTLDAFDERILEAILANYRTTSSKTGMRESRINGPDLRANGWEYYYNGSAVHYAPHYQALNMATYLWAYDKTGYKPLLERAKTGIENLMVAYKNKNWNWTNGLQQERAKMLLPLAWLVRIEDSAQHREWLDLIVEDMMRYQDATTGALRDAFGEAGEGHGAFGPFTANNQYGNHESPVIQKNGDPCVDALYTSSFAMMSLNEAYAATNDATLKAKYKKYSDTLADFFVKCQTVSSNEDYNGVWFRGFDYEKWEVYGSDGDAAWGVWATETGWSQAWISNSLSMKALNTNIWDYTKNTTIDECFEETAILMLNYDPNELVPSISVNPVDRGSKDLLIDKTYGSTNHDDGKWVASEGKDITVTIDYEEVKTFDSITLGFLFNMNPGICTPKSVTYYTSDDGEHYSEIGSVTLTTSAQDAYNNRGAAEIIRSTLTLDEEVSTRYLKAEIKNPGTYIKEGASKTTKTWIFMDELEINISKATISDLYDLLKITRPLNPAIYTSDTAPAFESAREAAESVYAKDSPSAAEIAKAYKDLKEAYDNLESEMIVVSMTASTDGDSSDKLIDGKHATALTHEDNAYIGWQNVNTVEAIIDLKEIKGISKLGYSTLSRPTWAIYVPTTTIYVSDDGSVWREVANITAYEHSAGSNFEEVDLSVEVDEAARYVKYVWTSNKEWKFIDEVLIETYPYVPASIINVTNLSKADLLLDKEYGFVPLNGSWRTKWAEFEGGNITFTVDLGKETKFDTVKLGFLQAFGTGICTPKDVKISVSNDNVNFTLFGTMGVENSFAGGNTQTINRLVAKAGKAANARYVKVEVKNPGTLPDRPGVKSWVFMDEIEFAFVGTTLEALKEAMDTYDGKNIEAYTETSAQAYIDAKESAKALYTAGSATSDEIDAAIAALKDAYTNLELGRSVVSMSNGTKDKSLLVDDKYSPTYIHNDAEYIGWQNATTFEAIVDLGSKQKIDYVGFSSSSRPQWGIYPPNATIYVSDDNVNWKEVAYLDAPEHTLDPSKATGVINGTALDDVSGRYVKYVFENDDNHLKNGVRNEWIFMDEVIINDMDVVKTKLQTLVTSLSSSDVSIYGEGAKKYNEALAAAKALLTKEEAVVSAYQKAYDTLKEEYEKLADLAIIIYDKPLGKGGENGIYTILDGKDGSMSAINGQIFPNGTWTGLEGKDVTVTITLPEEVSFNQLSLGFLQEWAWGVRFPEYVTFYVSEDGENYTEYSKVILNEDFSNGSSEDIVVRSDINATTTRYFKIFMKNAGPIPAGHKYAGSPTWLFWDEFVYETVVDFRALEALVDEVKAMDTTIYTEETLEALLSALEDAEAIMENADATQEDADAALSALEDAIENLKLALVLDELYDVLDELETLDPEDYTEESVEKVSDVLDRIGEAIEDPETTQEELDALVEELKEAIEALEEKVEDTPVVEPEDKPEGPGTGDSTNTAGLLALLLASIYVLLNRRKKA